MYVVTVVSISIIEHNVIIMHLMIMTYMTITLLWPGIGVSYTRPIAAWKCIYSDA